MDINYALILGCSALIFWTRHSSYFNNPERLLIDRGEQVIIRPLHASSWFKWQWKTVTKSRVEKIQRAKGCISLFYGSGHAIDMWISEKFADELFARAQKLFPQAKPISVAN